MNVAGLTVLMAASLAFAQGTTPAASNQPLSFNESGTTSIDGRPVSYLIRRLPIDSFPDLPDPIAGLLTQRGCLIPQTYQAHRPENVIHASLERPGSSDWAVLCSEHGRVDLLVFLSRMPDKPIRLASASEFDRLQRHDSSGVLGFDWGIDSATPEQVREAQAGMGHHPPRLDHDALAETIVNQKTVYHFFSRSAWTVVDVSD
ncbi:MAG TPA: hypothetical protein VGI45_03920 [Terracidiphilus sp.]|jgi:hypothetical protein